MFGRTFRIALLLIATQFASGCWCCCERPFFCRRFQCGNCCEQPCTTCCGSPPAIPYGPPPHGVPVYTGAPIALPTAPVAPPVDRMQPISSTALNR
jgi:hypothetical protein